MIYTVDTTTGKVIYQWSNSETDFVNTTLPIGWYKEEENKMHISSEDLYQGYIDDSEFDKVERRLGLAILDYIAIKDYGLRAEVWMMREVIDYLDAFIDNYRLTMKEEKGK